MTKRTAKAETVQLTTQIQLEVRADTPAYYVNYIGVSHTPYDFTLTAARVSSPPTTEQLEIVKSGKPMPLEPILQIIIAPLLIDGLIKALIDQKEKHAKTLAQQVKNNELQHEHIKPLGSIQ